MEEILTMSDTVNIGKNKKVLVSDLVGVKGEIFKLIKKGLQFDDEVLKEAHITKTIRDVKVCNVITTHEKDKKRTYGKETESVKNIIKSLNTLDNQNIEDFNGDEDTNEEEIMNIYSEDNDE